MNRIPRLAGAIVGALLVSGAAVAITAHAAGVGLSPSAAATPSPSSKAANRQADCQAFLGYFAKNLNTTTDKVTKAYQAALASTLADAVKNGQLTQAQADKLKAAAASGQPCQGLDGFPPKGAPGDRPPGGQPPAGAMDVQAAIAKALNLTPAQLKADFMNGQTVQQIAGAAGISEQAFEASVVASLTANLDAALKAGTITQAQHDAMIQRLPQTAKAFWSSSRPGAGGGLGGPHGPKPTPSASTT